MRLLADSAADEIARGFDGHDRRAWQDPQQQVCAGVGADAAELGTPVSGDGADVGAVVLRITAGSIGRDGENAHPLRRCGGSLGAVGLAEMTKRHQAPDVIVRQRGQGQADGRDE